MTGLATRHASNGRPHPGLGWVGRGWPGRGPDAGRVRLQGSGRRHSRGSDAGSTTLELAVLAPGLLLLLGLTIVAGRIVVAGGAVEQAAAAAARSASLSRDARSAQASAREVAQDSLGQQGVRCAQLSSAVDTSGFGTRLGAPASVSVEVTCDVELADVAVPGMPGTRRLEARATSPLDRFRGRS